MELRSSSNRHINKLPDELLTAVFRYLIPYCTHNSPHHLTVPYPSHYGVHSFLPPIGNVSRRWRRLLLSPAVCLRVSLHIPRNRPVRPAYFAFLHKLASGLEEVNIFGISTDSITTFATVLHNLPAFPIVKNLRFSPGPPITQAEWARLVELFPSVESFVIQNENKWLGDGGLQLIAAGWSKLVEMNVELSDCNDLTGSGLVEFCTVANKLRSIHFNGVRDLTDRHVDVISRLLGKSLKSIKIGFKQNNLSGSAIQSVAQNCRNLEEICISRIRKPCDIGHLKDLRKLRSFTMDFDGQSCLGLDECFYRPFGQLRELKIVGAEKLTDSHLRRIANSSPLLEKFFFSAAGKPNRFVTDSGVEQLLNKCNLNRSPTI